MYPPYLKNKVIEMLSKMDKKNLTQDVYTFGHKWCLSIEKKCDRIEIWFRSVLLVEYNFDEKILYENHLCFHKGKCWNDWINEARIGLCKYYHIRPKRISTSESYIHAIDNGYYNQCEHCNHSIWMINTVDRYCNGCGRTVIGNIKI